MKNPSGSRSTTFHQLLVATIVLSFFSVSADEYRDNSHEYDHLQQKSFCNNESNNLMWIVVQASTVEERTKLAETGMSLDVIEQDTVAGTIPADLVDHLKHKGFIVTSKIPLEELIAQEASKALPPPYLRYHHVQATLQQLVHEHPDIASLFSMGTSIQGRELWTLRLNTNAKETEPSTKPGAVFIGTIHAREHLATTVALELAIWLCTHKNNIQPLLAQRDIYITPMINPDGCEYDFSGNPYRYYRKNMRIHPDKKIGVDLNRNFGHNWGGRGSSNITGSETYRGPFAFSEPESRALKQFLESRNNIKTFISYHSYGELILYPWGNTQKPIEHSNDRKLHETYAQELAKITGYKSQQASKLYLASGDTSDWTYATRGIISFTIELFPKQYGRINGSGFYPTDHINIQKTIDNNIRAALYLIAVMGPHKSANWKGNSTYPPII